MGKQDKQYKGAQREMNDYENNRLSRIQENQARLRDLGVKSIENSLTSLVESQNPKKKKVKSIANSRKPSKTTRFLKTIEEQMKNYKPQEDESDVVDPYMVVMNKENDSYRRLYGRGVTNIFRLYGRGVTNILIKKVGGGDTSYMIPEALMESFKSNEVERN
ncbi:hypothetical protein LXL04_022757 [Taraxacum kok-saghyz]